MATYIFEETVPLLPAAVDSAALGTAADKFTDKDIGKLVKLGAENNYVLAEDGDDIEGMVGAIAPHTVNNGAAFGSVQVRFKHLKVRNKNGGALAVGATVVAAAQEALGTEQDYPTVKAGAGNLFKWRVKSLLTGNGADDTLILIEPLTR